jgi:hypothetical protein
MALLVAGVLVYELRSGKVYDKAFGMKTRERNSRVYWFSIGMEVLLLIVLIGFAIKG